MFLFPDEFVSREFKLTAATFARSVLYARGMDFVDDTPSISSTDGY